VGALILLCFGVFMAVGWPIYVETYGTRAAGVVAEKRENVSLEYGDWFRRFEVLATYSIPGQPVQHRAICDVDEKSYDSLHPGNLVGVHYFASLPQQPFLTATHLTPCSPTASINLGSAGVRRLILVFAALIVLLFLWRVLRIRMAVWLLFPWLGLSLAYLVLPRAEPEVRQPVPAVAKVGSVVTITTLGGADDGEGIPLQHPYRMVELKFVPPGMDTAVTAVDKVDDDSVPDLKEGQSVNIVYDAAHPRIARMQDGTRLFPGRFLRWTFRGLH
jgi:hypothetical protein